MEEENRSLNSLFRKVQQQSCLLSVGKRSELEGIFNVHFVCCLGEAFFEDGEYETSK